MSNEVKIYTFRPWDRSHFDAKFGGTIVLNGTDVISIESENDNTDLREVVMEINSLQLDITGLINIRQMQDAVRKEYYRLNVM